MNSYYGFYKSIKIILLLLLITTVSCRQTTNSDTIHHNAIVIDTHTDTPMKMINSNFNVAIKNEAPDSRVDFPRLKEGDVDAIFFALFTSQRERTPENYTNAYQLARQMLDSTVTAVSRNDQMVFLATSSEDIINKDPDITAICVGMENGFPLAKDLARVEEFYNRGVRYITLCHSSNNDICDSSTDPEGPEHDGLSEFGTGVVAEMNRLGMIVDVSHISDKSFFDVLSISNAPVIASHSSVRALCDHPRNMSDEMIKALAENGGVIQICLLGAYIEPEDTTTDNYLKLEELRKKYNNWQYNNEEERRAAWHEYDSINRYYPAPLPTITNAVDHIDHVVKLVGIDYVGIGSDFDGGGGLEDCVDVSDYPKITEELIRRGYSKADINKIWGGNFLRVFKSVEDIARQHDPS